MIAGWHALQQLKEAINIQGRATEKSTKKSFDQARATEKNNSKLDFWTYIVMGVGIPAGVLSGKGSVGLQLQHPE